MNIKQRVQLQTAVIRMKEKNITENIFKLKAKLNMELLSFVLNVWQKNLEAYGHLSTNIEEAEITRKNAVLSENSRIQNWNERFCMV